MTETNAPRPPGPWDPRPEDVAPSPSAADPVRAAEPPLDKGQNPVWAVLSTLLLGGFIGLVSGSQLNSSTTLQSFSTPLVPSSS